MGRSRPLVELVPIGVARTPWSDPGQAPKQGPEAAVRGVIEIDPAWQPGLSDLRPGDHLWVICLLEPVHAPRLMVHPRGDPSQPQRGLFTTRSPNRPAPLSLTLVKVLSVEGGRIEVQGLDVIDGTLVLDLKPYVTAVDMPRAEED